MPWDLSTTDFQLQFVLVKDGSEGGPDGETFYALYTVIDNEGTIGSGDVQVTPDASREISHITFFGGPGVTTPDSGATAALLGLGLAGLAGIRARFGRK